jgi:antirestriction protein ArdC
VGGHVRRGESGTHIVFFKILDADDVRGAHQAANDEPARRVIPLLRSFIVFNAAQVEGLPEALTAVGVPAEGWSPIQAAEELLKRSGAVIRHGGDRALYRPSDDVIQLPAQASCPMPATTQHGAARADPLDQPSGSLQPSAVQPDAPDSLRL